MIHPAPTLPDPPHVPLAEDPTIQRAKEQLAEVDKAARTFIRNNPTVAVVGALAVGFLVARVVTR